MTLITSGYLDNDKCGALKNLTVHVFSIIPAYVMLHHFESSVSCATDLITMVPTFFLGVTGGMIM